MNPSTLDIAALPACPVASRKQLPDRPGIYFVLDGDTVLYVGRAVNLRNRWANHHRLDQVGGAKIAYLEVSDPTLLSSIESACIEYFQPALNGKRMSAIAEKPVAVLIFARVTPAERAELERIAKAEDRSLANLITRIIRQTLEAKAERKVTR